MWQAPPALGRTRYSSEFCSQLTRISTSSSTLPEVTPFTHNSLHDVLQYQSSFNRLCLSLRVNPIFPARKDDAMIFDTAYEIRFGLGTTKEIGLSQRPMA